MAWEIYQNKPQIYQTASLSGSYEYSTSPHYWDWAKGNVWWRNQNWDAAIKYLNDTGKQMKIGKVSIKTCSCHSGGQTYWAWGTLTSPCYGWGGKYYVYIAVSNDGGNTFQFSSKGYHNVPAITSSNMNSRGSDGTHTAYFGNPPYTGYAGLSLHEYEVLDCPTIEPGGFAFVTFGIESLVNSSQQKVEWNAASSAEINGVCIRFILNPTEMEVEFEPETAPYIWQYQQDRKWHLIKPAYTRQNSSWIDVEEKEVTS